ncbi:MAG TPA: MlaD family protein [Solirubrobacteraceae bacterium]|jgi:virulence factor Mce-like protein
MQKRAPTLGNILVIILFVLSCFGLLMFLWESFGGPLPLKPKGYRMTVAFPRSLALAEQSDVRISGVDVGHVISLHHGTEGLTRATLELNSRYAPIRANMHAILRQKTLLGETYVQLIPEGNTGPYLKDNGELGERQVEPSVTLDDILSLFDPKTRAAFRLWQSSVSEGIDGRGEQINADFARLEPFAEHANKLVGILATQEGALKDVIKNTGVVFNALASRDHQLEGLIVHGEQTFSAAAEASQAFAAAFRALPGFERGSRTAFKEIDRFAADATPFFKEFQPAERELAGLTQAAKPFAPQFDKFLTALGPLTKAASKGLPELKTSLNLTIPVLENIRPILHNLDPFLEYTGKFVPELQAFFANTTAATTVRQHNANVVEAGDTRLTHYLSTMQVLGPESLAVYGKAIGTARSNAYPLPGTFNSLSSGLPVFSTENCADSAPAVSGPANETVTTELIELIQKFGVANKPGATANEVAAPACNQQGPFTFNGKTSQYPHAVFEGK